MKRWVAAILLITTAVGCKKNEAKTLEKELIGSWRLKAFLRDNGFNGFDSSDIQAYIDPNRTVLMKLGENHYLQHYVDGVPVFNFNCYWTVLEKNEHNKNRRIYLRPNYENADRVHDIVRLDKNSLILYYTWSLGYNTILNKYDFIRLGYWYVKN